MMQEEILHVLPMELRQAVRRFPARLLNELEEIRIRQRQPIEIYARGTSFFLRKDGQVAKRSSEALVAEEEDCRKLLNLISRHSVYALEEEMKRGYITIAGGHRVGIAGKTVVEGGGVKFIRQVTSFNIRVAREKIGAARPILPYLIDKGALRNTLIISPPQCGKTTVLRDLAREISEGNALLAGKKVGLVDERSELAGCVNGVPQMRVGPRTDVLDGCPKAEGMMMLIRSMSPDVIIADEIGRREDSAAVEEALHAGVSIITSAHGKDLQDVAGRPTLSKMIQRGIFTRFVILSRRNGPGTVEAVLGEQFQPVARGKRTS